MGRNDGKEKLMEIYLDNSATTMAYKEVADLSYNIMTSAYGNPSSMHSKGVEAEEYVKTAYKQAAKALKVTEKEILFTSGGTESDNLALIGAARANKRAGMHIITTKIEHPAILNTVEYLKSEGFEIDYLGVNSLGLISLDELKEKIRPDTILVSIMHTNNEVGSVQPIEEAGKLIKEINPNTLFHVDAVQGFGKAFIYPKKQKIDMLSVSGHKIHGPKGVGILYVDEHVKLKPISYGGGQQKGLRSGTLNVPGIAGMGLAIEMITDGLAEKREELFRLKNFFLTEVSKLPSVKANGCERLSDGSFDVYKTAPHIMNISVKGLRSEVMLHALEERGIFVSAGSACASHSKKESSTLKAMGASSTETDGALRVSMSEFTTMEELSEMVKDLKEVIEIYGRFTRR